MWLNVILESMHPVVFLTNVLYLQAAGACSSMWLHVSFSHHTCSCLLGWSLHITAFGRSLLWWPYLQLLALFSFGCSADLLKSLLWSSILQI